MMDRKNISSDTIWEKRVGYSRAVRIGDIIEVAGTTALDGDKIIAAGDPYKQMCFIIEKIEQALNAVNILSPIGRDVGGKDLDIIWIQAFTSMTVAVPEPRKGLTLSAVANKVRSLKPPSQREEGVNDGEA